MASDPCRLRHSRRVRRVVDRRIPAATRNTLTGSRANIEAHYDLSNELFAAFLDETLSYSSAIFDERRPVAEQTLADAQRAKIEAVLDAADVRAGARVLEIGTGWGSLAIAAARRGAHVTTITLSGEQAELARDKHRAAAGQMTHDPHPRLHAYRRPARVRVRDAETVDQTRPAVLAEPSPPPPRRRA